MVEITVPVDIHIRIREFVHPFLKILMKFQRWQNSHGFQP